MRDVKDVHTAVCRHLPSALGGCVGGCICVSVWVLFVLGVRFCHVTQGTWEGCLHSTDSLTR